MPTGDDNSLIPPYRNGFAPFVYFDFAAAFAVSNGVVEIELAARSLVPSGGAITTELVPVARLRCPIAAIPSLHEAIRRAMELVAPRQRDAQPSEGAVVRVN
jgi:hypothetical protein